eukprot:COSAG01_NODE_314_length_19013_cov_164.111240_15_plen_140_part_00
MIEALCSPLTSVCGPSGPPRRLNQHPCWLRSGRQVWVGTYRDEAAAARAYDEVARRLRGAEAAPQLNFPTAEERSQPDKKKQETKKPQKKKKKQAPLPANQDSADECDGDNIYEVDKIVGKRRHGKVQYLVRCECASVC